MSTRMTFSPSFAAKAARFRAVVVLPDPPLPDPRTSHLARFGMAGRASLDFWAAITPSAASALAIILNPLPHRPSDAFAGDIGNPAARKRNREMASRDTSAPKVANSPHLASRTRQLGARPGDVRTGSACGTGGDSLGGTLMLHGSGRLAAGAGRRRKVAPSLTLGPQPCRSKPKRLVAITFRSSSTGSSTGPSTM